MKYPEDQNTKMTCVGCETGPRTFEDLQDIELKNEFDVIINEKNDEEIIGYTYKGKAVSKKDLRFTGFTRGALNRAVNNKYYQKTGKSNKFLPRLYRVIKLKVRGFNSYKILPVEDKSDKQDNEKET